MLQSSRGRGSARGDAPGFVAIHPHSRNRSSPHGDQQLYVCLYALARARHALSWLEAASDHAPEHTTADVCARVRACRGKACVVLHRTRRKHYNLVLIDNKASCEPNALPEGLLQLIRRGTATDGAENAFLAREGAVPGEAPGGQGGQDACKRPRTSHHGKPERSAHPHPLSDTQAHTHALQSEAHAASLLVLSHNDCQGHVTSAGVEVHQEGPDRITAILTRLQASETTLPGVCVCGYVCARTCVCVLACTFECVFACT